MFCNKDRVAISSGITWNLKVKAKITWSLKLKKTSKKLEFEQKLFENFEFLHVKLWNFDQVRLTVIHKKLNIIFISFLF